jgi:glycosyltransferase involved in cell wall biosynthesis
MTDRALEKRTDDPAAGERPRPCELSIVMPCLDEAETLEVCIGKALGYLERSGVDGEVLVADNGSTDGSREIARRCGARVVDVAEPGYGAALLGGIQAARGRFIIMGDADGSYDFSDLDGFVAELRRGCDLVMGNRFLGGIAPGAMPLFHRYLGNPVLTGFGRLFFKSRCGDFHCGLRGFGKAAMEDLNLQATGMEFASEMVVRATLGNLKIAEVPTTLSPDGRMRAPHLRSWHDGWRHLRFLLMYSPRWLFLYPGLVLMALGLAGIALVLPGPFTAGSITFDVHTLLVAAIVLLLGSQTVAFAVLTKQFGTNQGLLPPDPAFAAFMRVFSVERALAVGVALILLGGGGIGMAAWIWRSMDFGSLDYSMMMRLVIPSVTAVALGFQIVIVGFLASILGLKLKRRTL